MGSPPLFEAYPILGETKAIWAKLCDQLISHLWWSTDIHKRTTRITYSGKNCIGVDPVHFAVPRLFRSASRNTEVNLHTWICLGQVLNVITVCKFRRSGC